MKEERDVIEELFKLSDIKAGLENVRDASKVVVSSFLQIGRELALPLRLAFNLGNDKKLTKILEDYVAATKDYKRDTRMWLRSLGAFDVDPDMLLYNPVGFFLTFPVNSYLFMADDPGAADMPPFYEKMIRQMGSDTKEIRKGLSALEKIFYESRNAVEDLISEQVEKPEGLTADAVDEILSFLGINAQEARDKHFDALISTLEQLRSSLDARAKIIERMKQVKDAKSLQAFVGSLSSMGAKIDTKKIKKQIEDLVSSNPDGDDISDMMAEIIESGVEELKSQASKSLDGMPDEDTLKSSQDARAQKALSLINDIKTSLSKF
jgi:hypothetical protein